VLSVRLGPSCAWCGALGLGQGWGLGDQVLNVCGEGVGDGEWRRVRVCCGVVLACGARLWWGRWAGWLWPGCWHLTSKWSGVAWA
jgi:hypothetical protein